MFCYTSGTTGDPKGAKVHHGGMLGALFSTSYYGMDLNENDVNLSYLPYAHIFEAYIFAASIIIGFSHGYYQGDPLLLL